MYLLASSSSDLLTQLARVDITVPPLSRGRTKDHTEQWSMFRFLSTYADSGMLHYPLELVHRDRPDYELRLNGKSCGVEVTASMPPQYAKAISVCNRFCPDAPIEPEFFTWDSPDRSEDEIVAILERSKQSLHGMGWVGDSVERQWAHCINKSILNTVTRLNMGGFEQFFENWLIVYDNIPQAALDLRLGMKHLADYAFKTDLDETSKSFGNIFIETHGTFISFVDNRWTSIELNDLWRSHCA